MPIRKIVVATDFSRASNRAFVFVLNLAKQLGAESIAVFVKNADDLAVAMRLNIRVFRRERGQLTQKIDKFIDRRFQALLRRTKPPEQKIRLVILKGNAWQEILRVAKSERADLIVTGTRSRSMLSNVILGSTARKLVQNSFCPVIVVNERQRQRRKVSP